MQADIERLRQAYDAFLAEYPLCYGYWKKYADAEARAQNPEGAAHVYERGVAATPYSADLWGHYAAFKKGLPDATPDDVRKCVGGCTVILGTQPAQGRHADDAMHMQRTFIRPLSFNKRAGICLVTPKDTSLLPHSIPVNILLPATQPSCLHPLHPPTHAPPCSIYERGLAYCSMDYNSHTLWDKYFAFEQEQASTLHVASLFSRVLACPIKELDRYYSR